MRYSEFNNLNENASCGASSSANVATAAMPFFSSDPKATAEKSIYGAQSGTKKKTKKKPVVISRND
jgi:hypothetical protein